MSKRMNEHAVKILGFPSIGPHTDDEYKEPKPGRIKRLGSVLGVIAMPNPDNPKVWTWNPSVITLLILLASLLTAGGYYVGHMAAEVEFLKQQQVATQEKAAKAENQALYAVKKVDGGDGHEVANTNTQEKK
jgi:hypothetical protein